MYITIFRKNGTARMVRLDALVDTCEVSLTNNDLILLQAGVSVGCRDDRGIMARLVPVPAAVDGGLEWEVSHLVEGSA